MSGSNNSLPQDVSFTNITATQVNSLKQAYTRSAALDKVGVSFEEKQADGTFSLSVHFTPLADVSVTPVPPPIMVKASNAGPQSSGGDTNGIVASSPQGSPVVTDASDTDPHIAWGRVVTPEFKKGILGVCARLKVDPNFLMACMAFETGQTFSPSKVNPNSGATGLIQFMPNTASNLGTTTAELAGMTAVRQLDFVERYFSPHAGSLDTLSDTYMAILWPKGIGQPESFVLFAIPSAAYQENKGLDSNNDGQVTKAEATARVHQILITGLSKANLG